MALVDLCAPLDADRRPSFHRSVVALGTVGISLANPGNCHASLSVGTSHIGGRFYYIGDYPDTLPPLDLLPRTH